MKKEIPPGVIIAVIVLIVLCVIGIGWKSLSGRNPTPEKISAKDLKPDPVPEGSGRNSVPNAQPGGQSPN